MEKAGKDLGKGVGTGLKDTGKAIDNGAKKTINAVK
jgi:hypothetical protein